VPTHGWDFPMNVHGGILYFRKDGSVPWHNTQAPDIDRLEVIHVYRVCLWFMVADLKSDPNLEHFSKAESLMFAS
jgi:hypothetical protein